MIRIENSGVNLYDTLMSGQCFRATLLEDGSFDVVLKDRVINIYQDGGDLIVSSNNEEGLLGVVSGYFDLDTDYVEINRRIVEGNSGFGEVVNGCVGYRVLKQDELEMLISYIISQNNNVKRISRSIEVLCELYGERVDFNGKSFYLFPSIEKVKELDLEKLAPLKIGFRDKYIMSAVERLRSDSGFLNSINDMSTEDAMGLLMEIKGIGMKVASCILLFGYARFDTYPVDTWVRKFVKDYYGVDKGVKEVTSFLKKEFSCYTGLCIQYMFHYNRNVRKKV